jgi:hypothetical protein
MTRHFHGDDHMERAWRVLSFARTTERRLLIPQPVRVIYTTTAFSQDAINNGVEVADGVDVNDLLAGVDGADAAADADVAAGAEADNFTPEETADFTR